MNKKSHHLNHLLLGLLALVVVGMGIWMYSVKNSVKDVVMDEATFEAQYAEMKSRVQSADPEDVDEKVRLEMVNRIQSGSN